MDISEYMLTITYSGAEHESRKEIIYRGNENILIREYIDNEFDRDMRIERSLLDNFMELIKNG